MVSPNSTTPIGEVIYLASSNAGKLKEILLGVTRWERSRQVRCPRRFELLPDFKQLPAAIESADSFVGNARLKALTYAQYTTAPVLADDSGLEVDSLGGAPGVCSARYAGPQSSDAENNQKLLQALAGLAGECRTAHFVCVLAIAQQGRIVGEFAGRAEGLILESPRGLAGFGYDPLFLDPVMNRTFAELTPEEKLERSHRGQALFTLLDWLLRQP